MSFFPKTAAGWTRSLAFPLFAVFLILLPIGFFAGWDRALRYVQVPFCWMLFGSGLALGLVCGFGKGLDRELKWCALGLAGVSVLGGPMFLPALAE